MRVLGTHLYQCTSWWCCERPWVFLKTLSTYLPVSGWVFYAHNCPQGRGFSSFLSKTAWPLCPTLTSHQISPRVTFFVCLFPWMKKVLKGKWVADVEKVKQKTAKTVKGIKIDEFKDSWAVGKKFWLVHCIKWRVVWRWLKFTHVRINTQLL